MRLRTSRLYPVCRLNRISPKSHFTCLPFQAGTSRVPLFFAGVTFPNTCCLCCGISAIFPLFFFLFSLPRCRAGLGVAHVGRVCLPGLLAPPPEHPPHQPGQVCPGHVGGRPGGGRWSHAAHTSSQMLFLSPQHHFGT